MEDLLIDEQNAQTHKKHTEKSKKGRGSSSTRRDPSKFEIVEVTLKGTNTQSIEETSTTRINLNIPCSSSQPLQN